MVSKHKIKPGMNQMLVQSKQWQNLDQEKLAVLQALGSRIVDVPVHLVMINSESEFAYLH